MDRRPTLSLNEWAVLGTLVERDRHGYDIAVELRRDAPLGDVWRVPPKLVYRALERLEALELVAPQRTEPSESGPPRTVFRPTRRGRAGFRTWLRTPVARPRDVRGELLLKLVLLERLGLDRTELLDAQRTAVELLVQARGATAAADDVAGLWRHHSALAVLAFLDDLDR